MAGRSVSESRLRLRPDRRDASLFVPCRLRLCGSGWGCAQAGPACGWRLSCGILAVQGARSGLCTTMGMGALASRCTGAVLQRLCDWCSSYCRTRHGPSSDSIESGYHTDGCEPVTCSKSLQTSMNASSGPHSCTMATSLAGLHAVHCAGGQKRVAACFEPCVQARPACVLACNIEGLQVSTRCLATCI